MSLLEKSHFQCILWIIYFFIEYQTHLISLMSKKYIAKKINLISNIFTAFLMSLDRYNPLLYNTIMIFFRFKNFLSIFPLIKLKQSYIS
jgi:hypothetical protein